MDYVQGLAVETLAAAVGSGSLLDDTLMPEPRLEEHRKQLPDAIRHDLEAIVRVSMFVHQSCRPLAP